MRERPISSISRIICYKQVELVIAGTEKLLSRPWFIQIQVGLGHFV